MFLKLFQYGKYGEYGKWNATDEGAFAPKAVVCRNKMSKSRFAVIGG